VTQELYWLLPATIQPQHSTTHQENSSQQFFTARMNHRTELHGAATHASTKESSDFEKAHRRPKPTEVQRKQFGRENPWAAALTRGEMNQLAMRKVWRGNTEQVSAASEKLTGRSGDRRWKYRPRRDEARKTIQAAGKLHEEIEARTVLRRASGQPLAGDKIQDRQQLEPRIMCDENKSTQNTHRAP
jgi:hypothetical protein